MDASHTDQCNIPLASLWPFAGITFGLAWGILGLYLAFPEPMAKWAGQLSGTHPLFYLAVYAPAIGGLAVVLVTSGFANTGLFLSRLLFWRSSRGWYVFLLFGIPLLFYGGAAIKGSTPGTLFPFASTGAFFAALGSMAIKGPVEEIGWRGLALPLLQRRLTPFWAGLLLGIVWALWHFPAFLLSGTPQSAWSFTPFFVGSVAVSLIMTALFNASRGSILLAAVFHFQLINPLWPDAQPYDMILFTAAAAAVVWYNRRSMFTRSNVETGVIPA